MAGFDEAWKRDKVLVCSFDGTRVRVWAWMSGWGDVVGQAIERARHHRRETGQVTWVERYGAPAVRPGDKRGFDNYRTGGVD